MKVYVVCKKFDDELSQFGDPVETLSDLTKAKNKAEQIIIEEKNKRKSRKGYLNAVSNTYPIVNETYLKNIGNNILQLYGQFLRKNYVGLFLLKNLMLYD